MGYYAQAFAVNIEAIHAKIGSHDMAFAEKLKASALYDTYASQCDDCDFDEIINDLITGRSQPVPPAKPPGFWDRLLDRKPPGPRNHQFPHEYGYALMLFADVLGTHLHDDEGDVFYLGKAWEGANKRMAAQGLTINLDRMAEGSQLFPIPPIIDWPCINCYSRSEIDYLLQHLDQMDIKHPAYVANSLEDEINDHLYFFKTGLRQCQELGVEWLSFLH